MLNNKLSNLLLNTHDELLITNDGVSLSQLKNDVARARSSIQGVGVSEIALYDSDAYRFLVWLLAVWQEGHKALIPVDKNIALNPRFSNWFKIGEFEVSELSAWQQDLDPANMVFHEIDIDFDALGVFTSGSTGDPVRIDKKIFQLENEVEALEYTFGSSIPKDVTFIRSVSHQHFFGMPFALFWTVSRGSKITRQAIKGGHEWNTLEPQVFITSPSFLKSITEVDTQQKNIGPGLRLIFSAGSVLDGGVYRIINKITNTRVVDIYGSSETGHIAWRDSPDAPWTLQIGVEFKQPIDKILEIKSKFCPNDDWFSTSDLACQKENSFEILGRADRILKIEGIRISLSQLINSIKESNLVEDCYISDLDCGRRSQLGCVVKLSTQGCQLISAEGKLPLIYQIKDSLRGKVNSIAIPRRWRFVDQFPKNAMGKVVKMDLDYLFLDGIKFPIVVSRKIQEFSLELVLDMPKTLACFQGHFDNFPVVPGVALVEWAIKYAEGLRNGAVFVGMAQVKFQKFIKPNQIVCLSLERGSDSQNIKFQYRNSDTIASSGILKFK